MPRAIGVEVNSKGADFNVEGLEIILCAGAIASAQLLMISGIGSTNHLSDHGIQTISHRAGVGQGLRDHPLIDLVWETNHNIELEPFSARNQAVLRYTAEESNSHNDMIVYFRGITGPKDDPIGIGCGLGLNLANSKGYVGLNSADYINAPWNLDRILDLLNHLWIPAIVLGTSGTASLIRIMRNNLLDELSKPYVVTASAKGMPPWKLILKYPVRVAINPLVSTVGYLLPALVSGSVIVSVVLSLPTLGPVLLDGIMTQDSHLTGFIILMLGVLTVVGTLVSDILLAVVDPRIRLINR